MARHMFAELAWLPRTPADFGAQCRAALADGDHIGAHIQALAGYALDANQLVRLGRVLDKARAAGKSLQPLIPFRLGLLGNGVLDVVVPAPAGQCRAAWHRAGVRYRGYRPGHAGGAVA